jgi:S1-C subfamily serine protease
MRQIASFLLVLMLASGLAARAPEDRKCQINVAAVFDKISPSVVLVSAFSVDPFRLRNRVIPVIGTGFVIGPGGLILTNSHVVYDRTAVAVMAEDGVNRRAEVLGADPILDLAVIRVAGLAPDVPPVTLGDSETLLVGEEVLAIGNSLGLDRTATRGIVSGLQRVLPRSPMSWLQPFIQTDAAINPGNSGGPLVDRCGEVVGVNTAMVTEAENIGFAVPVNIAKEVVPQLVDNGRVIRPWYGMNGKLVSADLVWLLNIPLVEGFLVETIEPGSPAEQIGLRGGTFALRIGQEEFLLGGDIITRVNGETLRDEETLVRIVRSLKVGDRIALEYVRDGERQTVAVVLPERPILPGDLPPKEGAMR